MNERRGTKGLELWCRKMTEGYPGVKIDNMSTSWRDGLAFCAMIHHFRPDLIDFSKLNKDDIYNNNELAFRVAEQYLGIPALLEPEDMVEYTVPDRLSILTYLSQFYQTFAVREGASSARIAPKRPQVPSEHGIVSHPSTSPPTKVALKAGKLRREPCTKCSLPVFLAERLNVGKSLFHRTCFRCARCNSELTLGNYYETENSEYCCEICPDEDKSESASNSVLKRSMSDEEKSASLSAFTNEADEFSAAFECALENAEEEKIQSANKEIYSARSNFFRNQLDSTINESVITTESVSCDSTPYDSGFPDKDITLSLDQESQNVVTKEESSEESIVKTRRRLFENNVTDIKADVNRKTVPISPSTSIPISIKHRLSNISDMNKENLHSGHTYSIKYNEKPPDNAKKSLSVGSLDFDEKNGKNQQNNVITISSNSESDRTDFNESIISIGSSLLDKSNKSTEEDIFKDSQGDNSHIINESIKSIEDCVEIMKTLENNKKLTEADDNSANESTDFNSRMMNSTEEENLNLVENSNDTCDLDQHIVTESPDNKSKVTEAINYNIKDVINDSESVEIIEIFDYDEEQKDVVETVNKNVKSENEEISNVVETFNKHISDSSISPLSEKHQALEKIDSYPEDLNPFDEDEANTESLNPFGSDDENEEVLNSKKPIPSPRFKKKKIIPYHISDDSFNPFESDDNYNPFDSDDDEKPVPVQRRKRISAPKISLNPFSSDDGESKDAGSKPVPLPRNKSNSNGDVKPKESLGLLYANYHFGSNSSVSSGSHYGSNRKKRPAPKPPIPIFQDHSNANSLASNSSQSAQHSPRATPKHRKNKRAPSPPKSTSTPNNKQEELIESSDNVFKKDFEIEQEKCAKEEVNRNMQSQNTQDMSLIEDPNSLTAYNKSTYGKWKRKKGQAPNKPVLQKRTIKCLPTIEIRKELELIKVQLQGLEKQGVQLELIIRDKCEGTGNENNSNDDISIEAEDLILQLFELVNEKNELFRKQSELMYLRRQQRLEKEHADVEYQIRCLMMQPETNKTDLDKAHEEELIKKLVNIVERRNQIIESLEMDRVREAEEDDSISNHINLFTLNREGDKSQLEKSKKEKDKDKKKHKKENKTKHKNKSSLDADKDVDTSEDSIRTLEKKKKKKFNLF